MTTDYPNDADGDALRRVAEDGNDMLQPMVVDFHVGTPEEDVAHRVADAAAKLGYVTSVYCDAEEDENGDSQSEWTCECSREMVATYDAIIAAQEDLNQIALPMGGYVDGWGTFGNLDTE